MTADLSTWLTPAVALAVVAYVFREMVLNRITAQAEKIEALDKALSQKIDDKAAALDARVDRVRDELHAADKMQEERFAASAASQGTRLGELEKWQYAVKEKELAVRRERREAQAREQSRAHPVPERIADEPSEP